MSARKIKPTKQAVAKGVTDVDRLVSANLVAVLDEKNRSRRWLAEVLSLNETSVDKYCNGKARITASRLWDMAMALDVSVARFFDGAGRRFS